MAKIPGKQQQTIGTLEQLEERLIDNELGICITDHGLYTKLRGMLVPLFTGGGGSSDSSALIAYPLNDELIGGDDDSGEIAIPVTEWYRSGSDIWIDENNQIHCNPGAYHVDAHTYITSSPLAPRIDTLELAVYDWAVSGQVRIDRSMPSSFSFPLSASGVIYVTSDEHVIDVTLDGLGTDVSAWLYYFAIYKIGGAKPGGNNGGEEPLI